MDSTQLNNEPSNLDKFNDSFQILHPEVKERKKSMSVLLDTAASQFSFEKEKPLTGEDIRQVIEKMEPKAKFPKFKNVVMNSHDNFYDSREVPTEEFTHLMDKVAKPKMR